MAIESRSAKGSRDVYNALANLNERKIEALSAGRGDEFVELSQAYTATMDANPDVVQYLDDFSRNNRSSDPDRAIAARKALPAHFDDELRRRNLSVDVFTNPKSSLSWTTQYGTSKYVGELMAATMSGQVDEDPEKAIRGRALLNARNIEEKRLLAEGMDKEAAKALSGTKLERMLQDVEATMGDVPGGANARTAALSARYKLATLMPVADTSTALPVAVGLVDKIVRLTARSYKRPTKTGDVMPGTSGDGSVAYAPAPYDALYADAAEQVLKLLPNGTQSGESAKMLSDLLDTAMPENTSATVKSQFDQRDAVKRLVQSVQDFDSLGFDDAVSRDSDINNGGTLNSGDVGDLRKAAVMLHAASSGALTLSPTDRSKYSELLDTNGYGNFVPEQVAQQTRTTGPSNARITRRLKQAGFTVPSGDAKHIQTLSTEELSLESAKETTSTKLYEAGVPKETVTLLGMVADITGTGINSTEQADRVLAAVNDPKVKAAKDANPKVASALVDFENRVSRIKSTLVDVRKRAPEALGRAAGQEAGYDAARTGLRARGTFGKATMEIQEAFARAGGLTAIRATLRGIGGAINPDSTFAEEWRDNARDVVTSTLLQSDTKIKALNGLPVREWAKTLTPTDIDQLVDLYAHKQQVSALAGTAEVIAGIPVGGAVATGLRSLGGRAVASFAARQAVKAASKAALARGATKEAVALGTARGSTALVPSSVSEVATGVVGEKLASIPRLTAERTATAAVAATVPNLANIALGGEGSSYNRPDAGAIISKTLDRFIRYTPSAKYNAREDKFELGDATYTPPAEDYRQIYKNGEVVPGKPVPVLSELTTALLQGTTSSPTEAAALVAELPGYAKREATLRDAWDKAAEPLGLRRNELRAILNPKLDALPAADIRKYGLEATVEATLQRELSRSRGTKRYDDMLAQASRYVTSARRSDAADRRLDYASESDANKLALATRKQDYAERLGQEYLAVRRQIAQARDSATTRKLNQDLVRIRLDAQKNNIDLDARTTSP